jgi:hypothetical protein
MWYMFWGQVNGSLRIMSKGVALKYKETAERPQERSPLEKEVANPEFNASSYQDT